MQQKHTQLTKITTDPPTATPLDFSPSQEPHNKRTCTAFATILLATHLQKSCSDQTGKFPVQLPCGCDHIVVLCDCNSNAILSKALKTREASKFTNAWTSLRTQLNDVNFQRVPPHIHHRNAAERTIQTWKNHLCSGLATCDPKFPLTEWDLRTPQAGIALNLRVASPGCWPAPARSPLASALRALVTSAPAKRWVLWIRILLLATRTSSSLLRSKALPGARCKRGGGVRASTLKDALSQRW